MTGSVGGSAAAWGLALSAETASWRPEVERAGGPDRADRGSSKHADDCVRHVGQDGAHPIAHAHAGLTLGLGGAGNLIARFGQLRRRFTSYSSQNTRAVPEPSLRSWFFHGEWRITLVSQYASKVPQRRPKLGRWWRMRCDAGRRSRRTTCQLTMTSSLRRRRVSFERHGFFQVAIKAR